MKRSHWRGFTLIELLVVISVISTLAALLLPVFAAARARGRTITCASNLKQLAAVIRMYSSDYNETLPLNYYPYVLGPPDPTCDHSHWSYAVWAYHNNLQIFVCPERPDWLSSSSCLTGGYLVNKRLVPDFPPPVYDAMITEPAGTLLLMDTYDDPHCVDAWEGPEGTPDKNAAQACTTLTQQPVQHCPNINQRANACAELRRHHGGVNIAFYDGHVKWMPPTRIQKRHFTLEED